MVRAAATGGTAANTDCLSFFSTYKRDLQRALARLS